MFSCYRQNPEIAPTIRAIQFTGDNQKEIEFYCDDTVFEKYIIQIGDYVIENPKGNPRTFTIMEKATFEKTYTSYEDKYCLSGGPCQ